MEFHSGGRPGRVRYACLCCGIPDPGFGEERTFVELIDADLRERDFRGANLRDAELLNARLSRANLRGADLTDSLLDGANMTYANLQRALLRSASLQGARLKRTILWWACLHSADLRGADLRGADFSFTDLCGADFRNTRLEGAVFREIRTSLRTRWPDWYTPPSSIPQRVPTQTEEERRLWKGSKNRPAVLRVPEVCYVCRQTIPAGFLNAVFSKARRAWRHPECPSDQAPRV